MIKKFKTFESAEYIYDKDEHGDSVRICSFSSFDARTFGYVPFEGNYYMVVGQSHKDWHCDLSALFNKELLLDRFELKYPGRLWLDHKVITFWEYPPKEEMQKLLNDINDSYDEIDWSDGWRIEVRDVYVEKLIPLEEYMGSESSSEEEMKAPHLLSPIEKEMLKKQGKLNIPPGFGSEYVPKHKLKGSKMTPVQYKNLKTFSESLNEDAEWVYVVDDDGYSKCVAYFENDDARAFGYYDKKYPTAFIRTDIFGGKYGIDPDTLTMIVAQDKNVYHKDLSNSKLGVSSYRSDLIYPGRMWVDKHIITFWQYPPKEDIDRVLEDIKENSVDNIDWSDDWKIEVFKDEIGFSGWTSSNYGGKTLIPLEEYTDSKSHTEEEIKTPHLLSPVQKEKLKKQGKLNIPPGFGSEYIPKHKLKGSEMTPAQYKSLTTFSESMITKFKLYKNDNKI